MRGFVQQGQLVLEIKNSVLQKEPLQRGIGLENVQTVVNRYGGILDFISSAEEFIFSVMLPAEQG